MHQQTQAQPIGIPQSTSPFRPPQAPWPQPQPTSQGSWSSQVLPASPPPSYTPWASSPGQQSQAPQQQSYFQQMQYPQASPNLQPQGSPFQSPPIHSPQQSPPLHAPVQSPPSHLHRPPSNPTNPSARPTQPQFNPGAYNASAYRPPSGFAGLNGHQPGVINAGAFRPRPRGMDGEELPEGEQWNGDGNGWQQGPEWQHQQQQQYS